MRYPDGGGLTAAGGARPGAGAAAGRGDVRGRASTRCRWRGGCGSARSRRTGGGGAGGRRRGRAGLQGRGRGGVQAGRRRSWPGCGRRWTRARRPGGGMRTSGGRWPGSTTLIGRLFHVALHAARARRTCCTGSGVSPQVPARRAAERDEAAIAAWRERDLAEGTRLAAATGAWICFEDEAGQDLRPPKARTWAPPRPHPGGHGVRQGLRAGVGGRADLPQARRAGGRLFYRVRIHRGRKGERRLHVRSRLRRPDRRRAPAAARPGHPVSGTT